MDNRLASQSSRSCDIQGFLAALRTAAHTGDQLVLHPTQVRILLSEEIYTLLSKLEARSFQSPGAEAESDTAPVFAERANLPAEPFTPQPKQSDPEVGGGAHRISCVPSLEELISDWLKFHVAGLAAPDRYRYSVAHLTKFFKDERRLGRVGASVAVSDLTPELQARFRAWRAAAGVGGHTISRDLAALRGALSWAWKHQRIPRPPFIADVPVHTRGRPRDRLLSFEEIAAIADTCVDRPDRVHLIRFIVIELGTAGRPQAVLELTDDNIDLDRNLINPNQPGRTYARKRRAIVPIAKAVLPWVTGVRGKLIKYRVPITRGEGSEDWSYFERETKSITRCWNKACEEVGVVGATPKTLRHTMLTWLAERGVPSEQRQMLAGHAAQGTTARNYEHLSPAYLRHAIDEVDAFFVELRKHTSAIDRPQA